MIEVGRRSRFWFACCDKGAALEYYARVSFLIPDQLMKSTA